MKCSVVVRYNPLRDIQKVVGGLSVDVDDMLRTGIVHSSTSELDSNGIDNPDAIIGLVRDEFAAIDAMRAIRKYGKKSPKAAEKAVESAASVASPSPSESS